MVRGTVLFDIDNSIGNKEGVSIMNAETAITTLPAISILIENDAFIARMQELHESIGRRAYEIFAENGFNFGHDLEDWQRAESELLQPVSLKLTETDDAISIRGEVPGFTAKEIEVKVDPHRIFISGKQEKSSERMKDDATISERSSKEMFRECQLPAEVDPQKVTAELKDGVLEIHLPKCVKRTKALLASKAA